MVSPFPQTCTDSPLIGFQSLPATGLQKWKLMRKGKNGQEVKFAGQTHECERAKEYLYLPVGPLHFSYLGKYSRYGVIYLLDL